MNTHLKMFSSMSGHLSRNMFRNKHRFSCNISLIASNDLNNVSYNKVHSFIGKRFLTIIASNAAKIFIQSDRSCV